MAESSNPVERAESLLAVLSSHIPPEVHAWLMRGLPAAGTPFARGVFFGFYAGVGRRLGGLAATWSGAERAALSDAGLSAPDAMGPAELARAALLLRAMAVIAADEQVGLAVEAFRKGDNAERIAVLRGLELLPGPERFVELAAEASRSHVQDVFDALACDNAFAARHLAELQWNQLVMKALFTGVSLDRIIGWQSRVGPELVRMVGDFAAERRAAGREVPAGIAQIEDVARQHATEDAK